MNTEERKKTGRKKTLRRISTVLGAMIVFITTYMLILPAITMEAPTFCGTAPHVHTSACYAPVLICGNQDEAAVTLLSGPETTRVLECQQEEHIHDRTCYDESGSVVCGKEPHTHGDACYTETVIPSETPAHVHTADC